MKSLRLSFCAALVSALCGAAASSFAATESATPEALVRQVGAGMLEAAGNAVTGGERREVLTFAEQKLLAHVDFAEAARLAAGTVWTRASAAQQRQLAAAFPLVMVRGYLEALQTHGGRTLAVLPAQVPARSADDVTVQSRLEGRDGAPLALEYALRRRGGEWKIYDIRVDGESLLATCRPLLERIARAEGIGGLIKRMKGSANRPIIWA
jgi:phospholipid transport system substrate-binding protein